jgi:hypothetical protein
MCVEESNSLPQICLLLVGSHFVEFVVISQFWVLVEDAMIVHLCVVWVLTTMEIHLHLLLVESNICTFFFEIRSHNIVLHASKSVVTHRI